MRIERLIVITDYESLVEEYIEPSSRICNGIVCNPFFNNGNWLLPLGWEAELDNAEIEYTVEDVELIETELD